MMVYDRLSERTIEGMDVERLFEVDAHEPQPTDDSQAGNQVCQPAEETAEAAGPGDAIAAGSTESAADAGAADGRFDMNSHPAWLLITAGVLIVMIGLLWLLAPSIRWLGRLPGDLAMERGHVRVYFPIATCILISVVLSAILWLVRVFSR